MVVGKIASILQDIREGVSKGEGDFSAFTQKLFAGADPEDIAAYSPQALTSLARESFDFLRERRAGKAKIRSRNPEGDLGEATVLDIVNDDMPFLVDSVLSLLNERGLEIKFLLHPVLGVKRDEVGKLVGLEEPPGPKTPKESFMHIHIARIDEELRRQIEHEIERVLEDVRLAVGDWGAMQARLRQAIESYRSGPPPSSPEDIAESIDFLRWLLDNHFTFLGMREYRFEGEVGEGQLTAVESSGLGILRRAHMHVLRKGGEGVSITPEIRGFLMEPQAVIITKSDVRAKVHRRAAMDYIGVKLFDAKSALAGELRVVGLFTSTAYTRSPSSIPLVRRKIEAVLSASGFNPTGHSGKALINVLEGFPRDELFQMDTETLAEIAHGILKLEERPRTRLFLRHDRFDRFVSAFVFIPRDRFNSDVRQRVGEILARAFQGRVASFSPSFGESTLVRVHYIILRATGDHPQPDVEALEADVVEAVRDWDDRLQGELSRSLHAANASKWRGAFPAGYRERSSPRQSLKDIAEFEALAGSDRVAVEFSAGSQGEVNLRLYHYGAAIPLSSRLPILENMGFRAIEETTYEVTPQDGKAVIHDVLLRPSGPGLELGPVAKELEATFMAVWNGAAENDGFNALTFAQGMNWRDAALLRALGRYLRQGAQSFSPDYMAQTLVKHAGITRMIADLFHARLKPKNPDDASAEGLIQAIEEALQGVSVLDEDRIIRSYRNLALAVLRTNFFLKDTQGRGTISLKLDSKKVEGLPEPKPFAEIFVYSPEFEGIHLRFGRIARGGIRWSDRAEDYRTEILGLAKAQNVKNVVIVPVGAKGGFVPRKVQGQLSREMVQAQGERAYRSFISNLLDITDNLKGEKVVAPKGIPRRDGDDPYLVVAADKGTATFSDIANEISAGHGFWLDDAFASGGSAGYDHKKMGITARGAWEAVKRHFRELGTDIATTPFTVMGIGDMSGDVFGNGMLLSRQIKLVAAFDHRDIFIDPAPDPETSCKERERLFDLSRSSWQDYDRSRISAGGGVFSRGLKAIPLSEPIKKLTGLLGTEATPQQVMNGLLKAQVDLIWLGGIGTYVKASGESNSEVGDRANDAMRVKARELRARVIGEGANLGVTQRGRVEFARRGGKINTDAIDNSAGVNSSDLEVNIKIALGLAEESGKITRAERNRLLSEMTEEVAALVLRNNYLQTLSISLTVARGTEENSYAIMLMNDLERRGLLSRELEALPQDQEVKTRDARREMMTRPEWAVLLAYAKIALKHDLLDSEVPDDAYLSRELLRYFPMRMVERHESEIKQHRLAREIVATMLANSMINRGGAGFAAKLQSETGASPAEIAAAFAVARDSFDLTAHNAAIDTLDGKVPAELQIQLYLELQTLVRRATQWFVRNSELKSGLEDIVTRFRAGIDRLRASLGDQLPETVLTALNARIAELSAAGVPENIAQDIAKLGYLQRAPDIVQVAGECGASLTQAAKVLYASGAQFEIDHMLMRAGELAAKDFFERLAINRMMDQLFLAHRVLAKSVLEAEGPAEDPWGKWLAAHNDRVKAVSKSISDLLAEKPFDLPKLSVAQGLIWDLSAARRHEAA
jgi:glutamate dehydrogenase